jgi:hypothetical protein
MGLAVLSRQTPFVSSGVVAPVSVQAASFGSRQRRSVNDHCCVQEPDLLARNTIASGYQLAQSLEFQGSPCRW